jgi:hypothetical protein
LLRAGRGILLDLSGDGTAPPDGQGWLGVAAGWSGRVEPVSAQPIAQTTLQDVRALLLRPDGYAAYAGEPPADAAPALHQWFGPAKRGATAKRGVTTERGVTAERGLTAERGVTAERGLTGQRAARH